MNKIQWIGGFVGLGIITIAGGNVYADKKLKDFYQNPQLNAGLHYKIQNYDMGFMSGTVKSTIQINLDPCNPHDLLSIDATDSISRNLFGYTIKTQLHYPQNFEENIQKVFGNQSPLDITSKINWWGNVDIKMTSPIIDFKDQDFFVNNKGLDISFKYNAKKPSLIEDLSIHMPSFTAGDKMNYFSFDKLEFDANKLHLYQIIDGAKSEFSINHLRFKSYDRQSTDIYLEKIVGLSSTNESKGMFDFKNSFNIEKFSLSDSNKFGKIDTNFHIKNVDEKSLKTLYTLIEKISTTCVPDNEQQLERAILSVLEQGLTLESNNNIISLGDSNLKADFSAVLDKGIYHNSSALLNSITMKINAEGKIETTKDFIQDVLALSPQTASLAGDQTEQAIQQLKNQGMVQVNGNTLTSKFEFRSGQPRFTNH